MTASEINLPAVLVVEDEPVQRTWVVLALRRAAWRVVEAGDGDTAIDMLVAGGISLVLMDVQLPGHDGFAVAGRIRALPGAAAQLPILGFTATPVLDGGARFRAAGMDGYVVKPSNPRELAEAIEPWRPSGAPLPAFRLEPLLGAVELNGLLVRFRANVTEALGQIDQAEGREARAHRLAGLAGTLGFADICNAWLAVSEGDESALESARLTARKGLAQLGKELDENLKY